VSGEIQRILATSAFVIPSATADDLALARSQAGRSGVHFTPVEDDPCGGRAAILDEATYERVG
jgi:hypothetical protein